MSSGDLWEDGFPHGTVEGFNDGCRGGACPSGHEHGLSCKRAKELAAGDYRYNRLVAEGKTPAEIAHIIDGRDAPTETPAPAIAPKAEPTPTPTPTPTVAATEENRPVAEPTDLTTGRFTAGQTQRQARETVRRIRDWARDNGYPGVASRGTIPQAALAAYADAHPAAAAAAALAEPEGETPDLTPPADTTAPVSGVDNQVHERSPYTDILDATHDRLDHIKPTGSTLGYAIVERPEWGDITVSEDVEHARNLAVRLEGENATLLDYNANLLLQHETDRATLNELDTNCRLAESDVEHWKAEHAIVLEERNALATERNELTDLVHSLNNQLALYRRSLNAATKAGQLVTAALAAAAEALTLVSGGQKQ